MNDLRNSRGSVLMEFVVVLPVYFLLLAFAFVIGEIGLHAIRLSASASRVYAMSPDVADSHSIGLDKKFLCHADDLFGEFVKFMSFDHYDEDGVREQMDWEPVSDFDKGTKKRVDCVTDAEFAGAWVKCVGATVEDSFSLTPVTRGFAEFWYRWTGDRVKAAGGTEDPDTSEVAKALVTDDGRMNVAGKDMTKLYHGYFSLQRNEAARFDPEASETLPYRHWSDEALQLENEGRPFWFAKVATEDFAPWEDRNDSNVHLSRGKDPPSEQTGAVSSFPLRNDNFDEWSGGH